MPVKTYFNNIQDTILLLLSNAEEDVVVAVAWLTSKDLFKKLCRLAMAGINVKVLTLKDEINLNSDCDFIKLEKYGGQLFWQESSNSSLMHHKFCVIDRKTVITGSFNWTNKASLNRENITVIENEVETAKAYLQEFNSLLPYVDDAIFAEEDYIANIQFDTPKKRLIWYESLLEEWKKNLEECADYPYVKTSSSISISVAPHEYSSFDNKLIAMLRLEHLVLSDIHELTGLRHLSDLKTLAIQNYNADIKLNDISDLKNLIKLEELDLAQNQIEDISALGNLKKLRELDLSGNSINDISSLSGLRKMEVLNISENLINEISPLQTMFNIRDLRFNYNTVHNIDALESKEFLERLDFEDNQVEDLTPLESCKNLQTIACGGNQIRSIEPLMQLKRLKYLKCKNNPLDEKKFSQFKAFIY